MISREHIESILRINGVSTTSNDDEIRSVLLSARYDNDEVDTAIMVLRQDPVTRKTRVDGLHKVFHTNDALNSHEISDLLGIDVNMSHFSSSGTNTQAINFLQILMIWLSSVFIAATGILLYLYSADMWPFAIATDLHQNAYIAN